MGYQRPHNVKKCSMKSSIEDQVKRKGDLLGKTSMGKDDEQEETGEEERQGSGLKLRRAISLHSRVDKPNKCSFSPAFTPLKQ